MSCSDLRATSFAVLCALALAACQSEPSSSPNGEVSKQPPNHAGSGVTPASGVGTAKQELGEVVNNYPSDFERMVAILTNLSRHSPKNTCNDFTDPKYGIDPTTKLAPLVYTRVGNEAARYTSEHMSTVGCFQHESCCTLAKNAMNQVVCTAPANCSGMACLNECTGGSTIQTRYSLLGFMSFSGENIAVGYPSAYDVWCGWMESDGHRANIYSGHSELGVGYFKAGGGGCTSPYWTQAFGSGNIPIDRIPVAGAMYGPAQPQNAANLYFAANYYHAGGAAPKRAAVVVNGHCFDMTKEWGYDDNGTWEARFNEPDDIPNGCQPYYFLFVDSDGNRHTYPDVGSLNVPIGPGTTCALAYDPAAQKPADCETGTQECEEGAVQTCYTGPLGTQDVGVCQSGHQTCKNGFWGSCRGQKVPGAEICDGLDNDCNGTTDEGNPGSGASCSVPEERGVCTAGTKQCIAGAQVCVGTVAPSDELCDGVDNDCDGVIDDGFGVVTCGKGECFRTVNSCINGVPQTCTEGTPSAEVADNRDNDCDGIIDDEIDCRKADGGTGQARLCYSFPLTEEDGGVKPILAPCARGTQVCQPDAGWSECMGEVGPSPEVCDGQDNDCDGTTDDNDELGWARCGEGSCVQFAQVCRNNKPFTCTPKMPAAESCNGKDDSCDGVIDENCLCREGTSYACYNGPGWTLDAGVCVGGTMTCNGGDWTSCLGEVVPGTEWCDSLDNDCDGVADDDCMDVPDAGVEDAGTTGGNDAGVIDAPDAGDGSGGGADGCGCNAGSPGASLWAFALLAFALIRQARAGVRSR